MKLNNCWEINNCGRQPGGKKAKELGVCPASVSSEYNGINRGIHGGRFCWAIAGTFCHGKPQGTFANKLIKCTYCNFFKKVHTEEGNNFILSPLGAIRLCL